MDMKFIGTVVDVLAIIVGAGFGLAFRGKLTLAYQRIVLIGCGLAAIVLGAYGIYCNLLPFAADVLEIKGSVLIAFSLVTGTVLGGGFGISLLMEKFGKNIQPKAQKEEAKDIRREEKSRKKRENDFAKGLKSRKADKVYLDELPRYEFVSTRHKSRHVEGLVVATMLLTFGCFAVTGPYNDGMGVSVTHLYIKAGFDAVISFALATVYGASVSYAAIPVAVMNCLMTLLSILFGTTLSVAFEQMAVISSVIMLAAGITFAAGKKFKVENMIPSLIIPPVYYGVIALAEKIAGV